MAAVLLLPVLSFAHAPIFHGVPGVINIGVSDAPAPGTYKYSDVFFYDKAVYDADSPNKELGWSFDEWLTGIAGSPANLFEVTEQTAITSINEVTSPALWGKDITHGALADTFGIEDLTAGAAGGIATGVDTYYNARAPYLTPLMSSALTATTITVYCSDGWNVTEKNILVMVTDDYDWTSGVAKQLMGWSDGAAHDAAGWEPIVSYPWGAFSLLSFDSHTSGYELTPNTDGGFNNVVVGHLQSPLAEDLQGVLNLEKGKMYRMSTRVWALDAPSAVKTQEFRLRMGVTGTTFDTYHTLDVSSIDLTDCLSNPFRGGVDGVVYENIFCPPQADRLDGRTYSTNTTQIFYDVIDADDVAYGDANEGSLVFGDTVIDELDIPEMGSNGSTYLRRWRNEIEYNDPYEIQPLFDETGTFTNPLGWAYAARQVVDVSVIPAIQVLHQDHGGLVGDTATTISFGSGASDPDTIEMFSHRFFMFFDQLIYGEPSGSQTNHDESAVPYDVMWNSFDGFGDDVWYRLTLTMRSTLPDTTYNPGFRMRIGQPFAYHSAWLDINPGHYGNNGLDEPIPGSIAGPVSTETTTYQAWVKGLPLDTESSSYADINNFAINVDLLNFVANDGGVEGTGGTLIIDDIYLEAFPAAAW
jgi:hypothetical protein